MKRLMKFLTVLTICLFAVLASGQTNYNKAVLINSLGQFTDPSVIASNKLLTATNLAIYGILTNNASGVNFRSLTILGSNVVVLGGIGGWTNLSAYYNDARFLTNAPAGSDTLQSVVNRGGTVISNIVTIDSANLRTNIFGGLLTILGQRVQEGSGTQATGLLSHAEGDQSIARGYASHAEGGSTVAGIFAFGGDYSHAEGSSTKAQGFGAHAEGQLTIASNNAAHAEGRLTAALGQYSHAEGWNTKAEGINSHAEGYNTRAWANPAGNGGVHAEGSATLAYGMGAHAEGDSTIASNFAAHAEGGNTRALGLASHAEGSASKAYSDYSHAEGNATIASNTAAHAEGQSTIASGIASHAAGAYAYASNDNSYVWSDGMVYGSHGTNTYNINAYGGVWFADSLIYKDGVIQVDTGNTRTNTYGGRVAVLGRSIRNNNCTVDEGYQGIALGASARVGIPNSFVWSAGNYLPGGNPYIGGGVGGTFNIAGQLYIGDSLIYSMDNGTGIATFRHSIPYQAVTNSPWLFANSNTLQLAVNGSGTVTSGVVTIDADNLRTNTYGGKTTILGENVQSGSSTWGSIIPYDADKSDLGSLDKPFRDLYVGTNSIYMAGQKVFSVSNGELVVGLPINGSIQNGIGHGTLPSTPTLSANAGAYNVCDVSLTNDATILGPTNAPYDGKKMQFRLYAEGADRVVTFSTDFRIPSSSFMTNAPTIPSNTTSILLLDYRALTTNWLVESYVEGY